MVLAKADFALVLGLPPFDPFLEAGRMHVASAFAGGDDVAEEGLFQANPADYCGVLMELLEGTVGLDVALRLFDGWVS